MFPEYSDAERIADTIVHVLGVALCLIGAAVLMSAGAGRIPLGDLAGLAVYSAGMVAMFTASASYNIIRRPRLKGWLRRIDHAVIFVMIAGSYTPFALKMGGTAGLSILIAVWVIAALGISAKLLFPYRYDKLSILLYLAQGWCVLLALQPLSDALSDLSFNLLLAGGLVYSLGVVFHLLERLPFHNVIWHLFVIGGAGLQYGAIYSAVIP